MCSENQHICSRGESVEWLSRISDTTCWGFYVRICVCMYVNTNTNNMKHSTGVRKVRTEWESYLLFIIYIIFSICSPRHYAFSKPLYHVCADFAQHIRIDSSTTVCYSLPKVTKISHFNSIHLCLQESPKCKGSTLSSNVNDIFSLLTFNFNL
jgi:hypothetical protein